MAGPRFLRRAGNELGFTTLANAPRDVYLLLLARYLRMLAYGGSTLILALFFARLGHSDAMIGLFMSATLVGDVIISLGVTLVADTVGRRVVLFAGGILMGGSGTIFAIFANYWLLLLAAVLGVISPSGNEIGPFRAIEEAILAQLSEPSTRSDIFAWYVVVGSLGTATGSLGCGWLIEYFDNTLHWRPITAYKFIFWIYGSIGVLKACISFFLSRKCEVQARKEPPSVNELQDRASPDEEAEALLTNGDSSHDDNTSGQRPPLPKREPPKPTKKSPISTLSRKSTIILAKLCAIFFFDSLASGMIPYSLIAFFMTRKFGMPEGQLGTIMSAAQFTSSIGSLLASAVAKRIGLVRAMVFTHLPSAILLALVPAPSSLMVTIVILVARASMSSMDQAPRSAFLAAVVLPEERTATMGIVNTVKTMSQSSGPLITGILAGEGRFWIAFVAAGCLKAFYDVAMLVMFVNTRLEGDKGGRGSESREPDELTAAEQFALEGSDDESEAEHQDGAPVGGDRSKRKADRSL